MDPTLKLVNKILGKHLIIEQLILCVRLRSILCLCLEEPLLAEILRKSLFISVLLKIKKEKLNGKSHRLRDQNQAKDMGIL